MNPSSRSPSKYRSNQAAARGRVASARIFATVNTETVSSGRCVHSHTLSSYATLGFQLSISSIRANTSTALHFQVLNIEGTTVFQLDIDELYKYEL